MTDDQKYVGQVFVTIAPDLSARLADVLEQAIQELWPLQEYRRQVVHLIGSMTSPHKSQPDRAKGCLWPSEVHAV